MRCPLIWEVEKLGRCCCRMLRMFKNQSLWPHIFVAITSDGSHPIAIHWQKVRQKYSPHTENEPKSSPRNPPYTFQASNLNSIFEQLQGPSIRRVLRALDQSKSTYCTTFARLCKEVWSAVVEPPHISMFSLRSLVNPVVSFAIETLAKSLLLSAILTQRLAF